MSKRTDAWRAVRLYNIHGFYAGRPYISYQAGENGRVYRPAGWRVYKQGENLATHWMDSGARVFTIHGQPGTRLTERRWAAHSEAVRWASERFGISDWMKDPYGGWGEAAFVKARIRDLNEQLKKVPV